MAQDMGWVTFILMVVLVATICRFCLLFHQYYILGFKLPGPPALPLVGNVLLFVQAKLDVLAIGNKLAKEYGGFYRLWFCHKLAIVITEPEHLEMFYNNPAMLGKSEMYDGLAQVIGKESILVASASKWKDLRKMLMTSFPTNPTKEYFKTFSECKNFMIEKLREKADGKTFALRKILLVTATKAITTNCLGESSTDLMSEKSLTWIVEEAEYLAKIAYVRLFSLIMRYNFTFHLTAEGKKCRRKTEAVQKWTEDMLLDRKEELHRLKQNGKPIPNIYIFNVLEKYGDTPMHVLRNELMNLIITGLDTLAGTIGFVMIALSLYPELQEQILREDAEVRKSAAGRELHLDDMKNYHLLERIIKETLRLYPVAPLIGRQLTEDTYFGKYLVPKETSVGALIYFANRNPLIFPEPLKFDPDRFLPQNVEKMHPFALSSFSAGRRWCPGTKYAMLAMKMYITAIVREFKVSCPYKSLQESFQNLVAETTLTDINDFPLMLTPRNE